MIGHNPALSSSGADSHNHASAFENEGDEWVDQGPVDEKAAARAKLEREREREREKGKGKGKGKERASGGGGNK